MVHSCTLPRIYGLLIYVLPNSCNRALYRVFELIIVHSGVLIVHSCTTYALLRSRSGNKTKLSFSIEHLLKILNKNESNKDVQRSGHEHSCVYSCVQLKQEALSSSKNISLFSVNFSE